MHPLVRCAALDGLLDNKTTARFTKMQCFFFGLVCRLDAMSAKDERARVGKIGIVRAQMFSATKGCIKGYCWYELVDAPQIICEFWTCHVCNKDIKLCWKLDMSSCPWKVATNLGRPRQGSS